MTEEFIPECALLVFEVPMPPHPNHQVPAVEFSHTGPCQGNGKKQTLPNSGYKIVFSLLALFWFLWPATATARTTSAHRVLILHELGLGSPGMSLVDEQIVSAVASLPYEVDLYSESFETALFSDELSQANFRDWYTRKYRNRRPDAIVAIGPSPLRFILNVHEKFFPGTPVLFCESTEEMLGGLRIGADFTGVWGLAQPEKTLEAALRLSPGTRHVFVVGGVAPYDRYLEALVKARFRSYESRLEFTYLTDLDMPTLLERLKHLPSDSIVYHTSLMQDSAGSHFIDATQAVPMIAEAANAPVFVVDDVDVGRGSVGGDVFSFAIEGREMAKMLVKVLNGQKPWDIPTLRGANLYLFDWRALQRWGFKETNLPPGSVLLNRQPTAWNLYKRYVIGGILVVFAQTLLIVGLLWQRRKKRKIQKSLAERLAFETLLYDLSSTFIDLPGDQVTSNLKTALARIAEFLNLNRIALFECSGERIELIATSFVLDETRHLPPDVTPVPWPWWTSRALRGGPETLSDVEASTATGSHVREYLLKSGIRSIASVPLRAGGEVVGAISFISSSRRVLWTEDLVKQLKALAEIFSNALKRKRSTEALSANQMVLQQSEERLRLAMDAAGLGGWESDVKTRTNRWFGRTSVLLGMTPTRRSGSPEDFWNRVHPEDVQQLRETIKLAKKNHTEFDAEFRCVWSDGTVRWLRTLGRYIYGFNDEPERNLGVLLDVTDRKRAVEALRESEERFRLVANTAPVMIWMSDTDKSCSYFNRPWLDFTGRSLEAECGNGWAEGVHPEDFKNCLETYTKAFDRRETFQMEYRLRRHDGEYRWVFDIGVPRFKPEGSFAGYIGSCIDVTERKLAQEALSNVSRRLIDAHEEERTRIARELHDDINQRLALLEIDLEHLELPSHGSHSEIVERLRELRQRVSETSSDIQAISHRLHSSKLEYLGIVAAAKTFCRELSARHKVEINFKHNVVSRDLPSEISLCLFRVLQEALHNAVKHSGIRRFDVTLDQNSDVVELTVNDSGKGFDLATARTNPGLGLISMQERVKLVNGTISVVSERGRGTTILVRVPLRAAIEAARAAKK